MAEFTFANPEWFWAFGVIPLWMAWRWWQRRGESGVPFSDMHPAQNTPQTLWARITWMPNALRAGVLILGILALARPQVHDVVEEEMVEGIDIMITFDISSSMLAEDFPPNRLEAARSVAQSFVDSRTNDRVGLIVFAGQAYTHAPLTVDYDFLQRMLAEVDIGMVEDGTAIGSALATTVNRLQEADAESRVVVLLTDGANNAGQIDPLTAAEIARAMDVRVYTVGVGTHQEEATVRIETPDGGWQRRTMPIDQIDEEVLQTIANRTGGQYFRATDPEALREIYDEIDALEKSEIETQTYTDVAEKYPFFLWPAFALLLAEITLRSTRLRRFPA